MTVIKGRPLACCSYFHHGVLAPSAAHLLCLLQARAPLGASASQLQAPHVRVLATLLRHTQTKPSDTGDPPKAKASKIGCLMRRESRLMFQASAILWLSPYLGHELVVAAPLDHHTVVQHQDLIGVLDGRQAVCDHQRRLDRDRQGKPANQFANP